MYIQDIWSLSMLRKLGSNARKIQDSGLSRVDLFKGQELFTTEEEANKLSRMFEIDFENPYNLMRLEESREAANYRSEPLDWRNSDEYFEC